MMTSPYHQSAFDLFNSGSAPYSGGPAKWMTKGDNLDMTGKLMVEVDKSKRMTKGDNLDMTGNKLGSMSSDPLQIGRQVVKDDAEERYPPKAYDSAKTCMSG
mmetsp:Transcript_9010/g.16324  ORF Transcript_9010/g.16324 Transcript_9010/m.16324 type:complete len:102 (-) Transcript_9010:297-602(-)